MHRTRSHVTVKIGEEVVLDLGEMYIASTRDPVEIVAIEQKSGRPATFETRVEHSSIFEKLDAELDKRVAEVALRTGRLFGRS